MTLENRIASVVGHAMEQGQTPGAVVLIGRGTEVLYHGAFGHRALVPDPLPMLPDTVFDVASLTKPIATATAIVQLAESAELLLSDPVCRFLPGFVGEGRESVTLWHLLTHTSGLPAYKDYLAEWGEQVPPAERRARVMADICSLPLVHPFGSRFLYSCLGYIVLASVVEVASGQRLDEFARMQIFEPLEMHDTGFNPSGALSRRCAATEPLPQGVLVGVVHDENARFLSGVGGNAGLFSTAPDLSRYMAALLEKMRPPAAGRPRWPDLPVSPAAARLMLTPQSHLPDGVRSLGWDVDTAYTPQVRGDLLPPGGVAHSGYTGTSIWADPRTGGYVVLLTNRVHLGREADISRLRRQVANLAAVALERA